MRSAEHTVASAPVDLTLGDMCGPRPPLRLIILLVFVLRLSSSTSASSSSASASSAAAC